VSDKSSQRDLTVGPVAKTLWLFVLPTLGANILQSLNQTISSIYLGKLLGEDAFAASTVAGMISFLLFSTIFGLAMAATILIGQAMGRRDIAEVRRTIGAATGFFIIAGIVISGLGYLFTDDMLRVLATPAKAMEAATLFMHWGFFGMPFVFVSVLLQSSLRGVGDAVTPLYSTILNVVLSLLINPVFIMGGGTEGAHGLGLDGTLLGDVVRLIPIPAMGAKGAALAGICANISCLIFIIARIYEKDLPLRLRGAEWHLLKPDLAHLKPIMAIGLPMGLSMIIMSSSQLVMMGLINREGVDTVAAFGAVSQLWSYIQMPAFAVGSAVSAMAAQNIGAGKWDRIDKIMWAGVGTNLLMTAVLVCVTTFFAPLFLSFFLPHGSAAIPIGVHIQWVVGWSFLLMGISMVVTSIVRANGAVLAPLLILIFGSIFVRLAVAFLGYPTYGADAIWWSGPANSIASGGLALLYYRRGSWRKLKMVKAMIPGLA
jgi:putative MATE family efflux protein